MQDIEGRGPGFNLRDIGGLPTLDGRRVRERQIYRSEAPHGLDPAQSAEVQALGIHLVCDLRGAEERRHGPSQWHPGATPETLLMDVTSDLRSGRSDITEALRRDTTARGAAAMMHALYAEMPKSLLPHLRTMFERLLEGSATPMMIHCTAGKDRTGVCCAFILLSLGVTEGDVVTDYLLSARFSQQPAFQAKVARAIELAMNHAPSPEIVSAIAGVRPDYLMASLQAVKATYGSIEAYLLRASLDARRTSALRERLLDSEA